MTTPDGARPAAAPFARRRRSRHRARARRAFGPAFATAGPAGPAGPAGFAPPPLALALRAPASRGRALASGSLSLALHAGLVAALLVSAWTAPDVVEEIIPVRILRDTAPVPEPAPARRVVAPRRTLAAPARRVVAAPRPAAAAPSTVAPRVAPAPSPAATIEAAAAPRPVAAPARLEAPRVVAPRALVATSPQAVAVARFETPSVAPAERVAPVAATSGPRVVAPTAPVAVTAPRGFADTAPASDVDYGARASVEGVASGEALAGGASAVAIDAGTEDAAHGTAVAARAVDAGGGGAGGIGTAAGGIPCSERASVHDYMTEIESRVKGEWKRFELPPDLPPNAKVVLSFVLDESGTARDIEVRSAPSAALGESCRRALVAASPFPPLQGNERCLAGRRRIATFTVPVDESFRP